MNEDASRLEANGVAAKDGWLGYQIQCSLRLLKQTAVQNTHVKGWLKGAVVSIQRLNTAPLEAPYL